MHTYKNKQEMKKCINKKIKIRKRDRTKQKISVKVSKGKSIEVKKTYIPKFSKVDKWTGGHDCPTTGSNRS